VYFGIDKCGKWLAIGLAAMDRQNLHITACDRKGVIIGYKLPNTIGILFG
jgi:hypothetical protein